MGIRLFCHCSACRCLPDVLSPSVQPPPGKEERPPETEGEERQDIDAEHHPLHHRIRS